MGLRLLIGVLVGIVFVLLSVWRRVLTLPGALLAMAMLLVILAFGGFAAAVYILAIFFLCALVHALNKKKKNRHSDGARGVRQVACNGLIGAPLLALYGIFPEEEALLVGYYAAIAEFFADTMASDIGTLFPGDPIDICRLRRIERGRSGGVSLMGTLASFLGCLIAFLLALPSGIGALGAAVAAGAAFLGMLIDSVLGSLVQGKHRCTVCAAYTERRSHCGVATERIGGLSCIGNSTVNILSNIAAAAIALGLWWLI